MLFTRANTAILDRGISPSAAKQRQTYDLATERMLIWFSLPELKTGVTIQEATLVLAVLGPVGQGVELKLGRILRMWDPSQATWLMRTPMLQWGAPGGGESIDFTTWRGTAASVVQGTTPANPVHVSFDVTQDLQRSQRQVGARPGWILSGTARVGGALNVQLPSSPALAVKYSGAQAAVLQAGLAPGGL